MVLFWWARGSFLCSSLLNFFPSLPIVAAESFLPSPFCERHRLPTNVTTTNNADLLGGKLHLHLEKITRHHLALSKTNTGVVGSVVALLP